MDFELSGRTALVMGASSGLGLAVAESLAKEQADLVLFARREDLLRQHSERLDASYVAGDVSDASALERAVQHAVEKYGRLDVLVLNGGGPPPGLATDLTALSARTAFDLLLRPVVAVVNSALPHLRQSGHGRIISISSSSVDEPIANLALSNAIRPGVWGYLKTLAAEVAQDGITVNSVGPGRIATDRIEQLFSGRALDDLLNVIPAGRLGAPEEIGDIVCMLASRQASYLTGVHLNVDGGLTRSL